VDLDVRHAVAVGVALQQMTRISELAFVVAEGVTADEKA